MSHLIPIGEGLGIQISPHPRAGWEKYYAAPEKEENLLEAIDHEFSEEDWQWK